MKNSNIKATLKNSLFAFTLVGFSALSWNAGARAQTDSPPTTQRIVENGDTVR